MNGSGNSQQWWRFVRQIPRTLAVKLIHGYRLMLSPLIGNQCRFYPTCSHYAEQALIEHGFVRGSWLAARRLGRCHPFNPGGVDEVPPALSQVAVCSQHKSNQL